VRKVARRETASSGFGKISAHLGLGTRCARAKQGNAAQLDDGGMRRACYSAAEARPMSSAMRAAWAADGAASTAKPKQARPTQRRI